jgi:hypothetical protein
MDVAGIPKPKEDGGEAEGEVRQLPQTLVRIPIHQAEAAQREQELKYVGCSNQNHRRMHDGAFNSHQSCLGTQN